MVTSVYLSARRRGSVYLGDPILTATNGDRRFQTMTFDGRRSATINGRIVNSSGRGLKDVKLTATALSTGAKFYATPDSNGNYRFADLPVSDSYLIEAKSRYFKFEPASKIVTLNGDLADIDFTAVSLSKTR